MFKKGILLWQHKLICFFNLEKSVKSICGNLQTLYDISFLFTVSYFLSKVLRKPGDGRNRNLEIFWSIFPRKLQRCHYRIVKCREKLEKLCKDLPTIVGQQKKFIILRIHFLQKINVGRENTSSQWLISFRKYNPVNCFYKPKETLVIIN